MEGLGISWQENAMSLPPCTAVAWPFVLMANDNDSDAYLKAPIQDGVWKDAQWEHTAALRGWCAETRMRDQEFGNAFELIEKPLRYQRASLFRIEIQGGGNILLCVG